MSWLGWISLRCRGPSRPSSCASASPRPVRWTRRAIGRWRVVAEAKAALPAILPDGRAALLDLVADAVVERYR